VTFLKIISEPWCTPCHGKRGSVEEAKEIKRKGVSGSNQNVILNDEPTAGGLGKLPAPFVLAADFENDVADPEIAPPSLYETEGPAFCTLARKNSSLTVPVSTA
jgi:hypothetical protein